MAFKETKVGTVTWVDTSTGAFVEDLSKRGTSHQIKQTVSPSSQVFVPSDVIRNVRLKEGQLVEYEEEDNVATKVRPLG